jgi:cell division protein FtsQ
VGAAVAGVLWLMRSPLFPIRSIQLDGDLARNSVPTIRANAAPQLAGNFFSVNLQQGRAAFEAVPWVRRAVVRRVWPDRLAVRLEEHRAVALWQGEDGADMLVNSFGEVFEANVGDVEEDGLPTLAGPEGSAPADAGAVPAPAAHFCTAGPERGALQLSGRGSWRVELDSGATWTWAAAAKTNCWHAPIVSCAPLSQATGRWQAPLEYADLRHTDGYAVRLRGVSTTAAARPRRSRHLTRTRCGKDKLRTNTWPKNSRTWSSGWTSAPPR